MRSNKDILRSKDSEAYIDEHEYDGSVESIHEAMDEARKESSIEFNNWIDVEGWYRTRKEDGNPNKETWHKQGVGSKTTIQLYDKFEKENNK